MTSRHRSLGRDAIFSNARMGRQFVILEPKFGQLVGVGVGRESLLQIAEIGIGGLQIGRQIIDVGGKGGRAPLKRRHGLLEITKLRTRTDLIGRFERRDAEAIGEEILVGVGFILGKLFAAIAGFAPSAHRSSARARRSTQLPRVPRQGWWKTSPFR